MSLDTLIADTRKAIVGDAANAHAVFTAQGTLVGVTEVDISTGSHTFKVDEPPALGGADAAANPVQYALASLGSCQAITYRFWAAQLGVELDSTGVPAAPKSPLAHLVTPAAARPHRAEFGRGALPPPGIAAVGF